MSVAQSADFTPLVSRTAARSAISDALRLYVGRGRRYTVKKLGNGTGVPDRLIECAMCDPDDPEFRPLSLENLLSVSAFLGAAFTSDWLKLADLGAHELPDHNDPDFDALGLEANGLAGEVAQARSPQSPGGTNIVPIEKQAIRERAQRVVSKAKAA
jgi:hypothetical protein